MGITLYRSALLNLMPTKIATETQILRCLSNTPLQIDVDLIQVETHVSKHTSAEHLDTFYKPFSEIKNSKYDGMIITGAPIETLPFEEVEYWDELCRIMEWSKTHVHSTLHICWGAQAGLYYHYGVPKHMLPQKLSGVFTCRTEVPNARLFHGFDHEFLVPHSRNTEVRREDIEKVPQLRILATSDVAGVHIAGDLDGRQFFVCGHHEYDTDTLLNEYQRDVGKGLDVPVPQNYFPNDDPTKSPVSHWHAYASLLYTNWLNYYVYQTTPYEIENIE